MDEVGLNRRLPRTAPALHRLCCLLPRHCPVRHALTKRRAYAYAPERRAGVDGVLHVVTPMQTQEYPYIAGV